ncbi:hypothetical protein [Ralstonia mannitolilytica]|uniref:hypothetical protein n=1 Tax=Ralstonia mannitolilytica TaxID=105219 RepID=UPI0028F54A05|nr:hypothetical protein [Ralstonia mannitolilytica]CAJ0736921.1 hypothetical protein R76696_01364 [Ralstonia mannitolilytica]
MPTIVRIFTDSAAAEAARLAVLSTGLARERVALSHQADEAGALCGNFLCGDYEPGGEIAETYERKFQNVVIGGRFLLTIDAEPSEVDAAEAALHSAGGRAVDDLGPER